MRCHTCGETLQNLRTDMPFKISQQTIVILKELPILFSPNCGAYLIEDPVMKRVEEILGKADRDAELEIVRYAA